MLTLHKMPSGPANKTVSSAYPKLAGESDPFVSTVYHENDPPKSFAARHGMTTR